MGVFTHTMADYTSPISPARLFQAFSTDNGNFMPKAVPEFVKSVDVICHGDSNSVGCIKQFNSPEGRSFKYAKNRIDEIDSSKYYVKYTTIESDLLRDTIEYIVNEVKFEPSGDGTRHTKVGHYHTKGDYVVTDAEVDAAKAAIKKVFNAAEEYLIANPQLYA